MVASLYGACHKGWDGRQPYMALAMKAGWALARYFRHSVSTLLSLLILSKVLPGLSFPHPDQQNKKRIKNVSKKNSNAVIFCTGSLYFVGEILNLN